MKLEVFGIDAANYCAHALHRSERTWTETNCYVDLWIELLHSMRLDPIACMAFTVAMDFEGDQWTFFKQPSADLFLIYGIDVQELAIWRPVRLHVAGQIGGGRIPVVEVDAFYLPDTAGVSYALEHTKTTIAVEAIDMEQRRLGYFHNAGYFELCGADFDGLFDDTRSVLAPYTEIAKVGNVVRRNQRELAEVAAQLIDHYTNRLPTDNPFTAYRERYVADEQWLAAQDMSVFYKYAFATLRQCGACAEMASTFLAWFGCQTNTTIAASADFAEIASAAKAMQFKIARMVTTGKRVEITPLIDRMGTYWARAASDMRSRYGA